MSDTIDEDHAQAVLAALVANTNLGAGKVFDGRVTENAVTGLGPPPPYVLVYFAGGWPKDGIATALNATQVTYTATFTCHCVGESAAGARAVGMQVRSTLLNVRPVISGRACTPIKEDESIAPTRDETTGRLVMDAVRIFSFTSVPG